MRCSSSRTGLVSEGGTWNLGFVDQDGTVIWPDTPVLPGTTMLLLQSLGTPKQITAPVRIDDVPNMAAAFATNTTIGVRSVCALGWSTQRPQRVGTARNGDHTRAVPSLLARPGSAPGYLRACASQLGEPALTRQAPPAERRSLVFEAWDIRHILPDFAKSLFYSSSVQSLS
ncbi:aminotransferase class IV [Streptomyces sp. NPDC047453]|uniref:aminotransferase class IV n=1 Tax=Streptomyces sp. NPDC047453 TaxID=3154812 RepID=UPI0033F8F903